MQYENGFLGSQITCTPHLHVTLGIMKPANLLRRTIVPIRVPKTQAPPYRQFNSVHCEICLVVVDAGTL